MPLQDLLPQVSNASLPDVVFHYTDVLGLIGIVERGVFWATDYRYMSDSAEIQYVFRLASTVATERLQRGSTLNRFARAFLERAAAGLHPYGAEQYYLCCFSEVDDSLSQWRAYGGRQGFSLGVPGDVSPVSGGSVVAARQGQTAGISLLQVIYDPTQHRAYVDRLIELVLGVCSSKVLDEYPDVDMAVDGFAPFYWGQLERVAYRFKHVDFADEREWRLVSWGAVRPVLFRSGRTLTPYVEFSLESASHPPPGLVALPLTSVRYGPSQFPAETGIAVDRLLRTRGYPEAYCAQLGSQTPARL